MNKIEKYLLSKNIKVSNKGFAYLCDAIKLVQSDNTYLRGVTKRLYPDIAKLNDDTASKVERAMRHSISLAKIYYSNSEFIARAALELK